ncbi:MAG: hypothetical protein ACOY0R_09205 [Chloroflexota bacterium]
MSDKAGTHSIMLRIRRITYEDAYVAVPVTDALMRKKEDGSFGLDVDALVVEALRISDDQQVEWQVESSEKEPHPTQKPKPEDRKVHDAFHR